MDEVMDRSDEGPAEAIYTSVRYEFQFRINNFDSSHEFIRAATIPK